MCKEIKFLIFLPKNCEEVHASLVERLLLGELKNPHKNQNQDLRAITPMKPTQQKLQTSWSRDEPSLPQFLTHTIMSK